MLVIEQRKIVHQMYMYLFHSVSYMMCVGNCAVITPQDSFARTFWECGLSANILR